MRFVTRFLIRASTCYGCGIPEKIVEIGIWIKRKVNENYKSLNSECLDLTKAILDKKETLEVVLIALFNSKYNG